MSWVCPGVELVFARRFRFIRVFIKLDLPTLERPTKAISGNADSGYSEGFVALVKNSAAVIFITP